jgi:ribose 5-phosphate isomerase B
VRIAVGSDHRGIELKQSIIDLLTKLGYEYGDLGGYSADPVDYPDIAKEVALAVAGKKYDHGILICGSGIGMSIAANKVKGIRAALCCNVLSAERARLHNDANILCLGRDIVGQEVAFDIVKTYLATSFEGGRHQRRIEKIRDIEAELLDKG